MGRIPLRSVQASFPPVAKSQEPDEMVVHPIPQSPFSEPVRAEEMASSVHSKEPHPYVPFLRTLGVPPELHC